ncbi:hypothetical protein [Nostoc sp. PA-18-2419]|nr:hypothetical protein [Nostoc sp. PA-18-2419]
MPTQQKQGFFVLVAGWRWLHRAVTPSRIENFNWLVAPGLILGLLRIVS